VTILLSWLLYIFVFKAKKIKTMYSVLAERYSFNLDMSKVKSSVPYPEAKGIYRKRRADIGTFDKSDGGEKKPHTYIKIGSASNTDFSFIIQRRTRDKKHFHSREEILTGDADFEKEFIIQSNNHELIKKILDYTNMNKLIHAAKMGYNGEMLLLGGEMMYIESNIIKTKNDLMRTELLLHAMCDLCDDIEHYTVVKL
jgi:hypothetical protein